MMFLALLLCWITTARVAYGTPLVLDGFDTITDTANSTADDCADWTETRHGSSVDADIRPVTSPTHDNAAGGSSTSKHALQAVVGTTARWVRYTRALDFTAMGTATIAFSLRMDTGQQPSGGRRTAACLLESDADPTTDPGCCVVVDTDRTLHLVYMGSNEGACTPDADDADCDPDEVCMGSICRKVWVHSAEAITVNSCSSDKTIPCTSAGDCPSTAAVPSPSCNQPYWAGIELGQTVVAANSTICRLRLNGRVVSENAIETPIVGSPVENVVDAALGVLDYGSTVGTATFNFDDFVMDSAVRAGYGYVGLLTPSGQGTMFNQWTADTSCAGNQASCVRDWGVSPYTFDSGLTINEAMRVKKPGLSQDFTRLETGGSITLGPGEIVPAVESVAIMRGAAAGSASDRAVTQSILVCDDTTGTACGNAPECCETESPTYLIPNDTSLGIYRYLSTTSPKSGFSSWASVIGLIGQRFTTKSTYSAAIPARITYTGATGVYVRVSKPDRHEARTGRDGNKGTDDGKFTVAYIGDSTSQGTVQASCIKGASPGESCTQDSYCSWDSFENGGFQDLPAGGCMDAAGVPQDSNCSRCLIGGGYKPCPSGTCSFGSCGAEVAGKCEDDQSISCAGDGDCTATCDTAPTCIDSCPNLPDEVGFCPTSLAGWPNALAQRVDADVQLNCGLGAEDTGQMLTNRFNYILDGVGKTNAGTNSCLPGDPTCSYCQAIVGGGVCSCDSHDDCDPNGTCSCTTAGCGGTCLASDSIFKLFCPSGAWCNYPDGQWCQFSKPDLIATMEGYNDQWHYGYLEQYGLSVPMFDTECATMSSARSYSNTIVKHCPTVGSGPYQKPLTLCETNDDCAAAGNSSLSVCLGQCANGSACIDNTGGGCGTSCRVNMPLCDRDRDCPNGRPCINGRPDAPGTTNGGYCGCTSDSQCAGGFVCVRDAGDAGICRKICTADANCSPLTCDTTTCASGQPATCDTNGTKFCRGKCTTPCGAISCTSDAECGGTLSNQRWGGLRSAYYRGTCNKAAGRCTCCGALTCANDALMKRGCSCTTNADCPGGTCNDLKECVGGSKSDCQTNAECPGFQCLRCSEQLLTYLRTHQDLYPEVAQRMQASVDSLSETDGRPTLVFSGIPQVGGLVALPSGATTVEPDITCRGGFNDRPYYESSTAKLRSVVPTQRVVDQSFFNTTRHKFPYHADVVHYSVLGATVVGSTVGDTINALNVCVKPDGTAQRYCQNLNGSFPSRCTCAPNGVNSADCGTGGICTNGFCTAGTGTAVECSTSATCNTGQSETCSVAPICVIDTDCPSDEVCARRRCDSCTTGSDCGTGGTCSNSVCTAGTTIWRDANCPASTDGCNNPFNLTTTTSTSSTSTSSTTSTTIGYDFADTFDRPALHSGGPCAGGGDCWNDAASNDFEIEGNDELDVNAAGESTTQYTGGATTNSNSGWACIRFGLLSGGDYTGPCICDAAGDASCICCITDISTTAWSTERTENGPFAAGPFTNGMGTFTALTTNDWFGIRRTGTNLYRCFTVRSGTYADEGTTTFTETGVDAAGRLGYYDSGEDAFRIDEWQGGVGALPATGACGR